MEKKAPSTKAEPATCTLEQFVRRHQVNPGLVASFSFEATKSGDKLGARAEASWEKAFAAQAKKKY